MMITVYEGERESVRERHRQSGHLPTYGSGHLPVSYHRATLEPELFWGLWWEGGYKHNWA